ncbi:MAG: M28 family metallopeptidase [Acetobacteraceae bacterium]
MSATIESLCTAVDGGTLMRHVGALAQWQKLSGSAGEADSLGYLRGELDALGFRTQVLSHDAYISLPGRSLVQVDNAALRSITHSFSRAAPDGVQGPLVHVGAGNDADFAGRDLRGCIVLVDGIATPPVTRRASLAGAIGQLHISPHEHLHEMCISPVWGSPTAETVDQLPSTVVCSVLPSDGAPLRERLARGEQPSVTLQAEVDTGWRKTPILVAELGTEGDAPFVLFSGHHDTWYYGVMDNGSANATMLEVARLCGAQRGQWQRGLRLCFWSGHSHGRYSGSSWYLDRHWDELDTRCVAHINVDSPGARGADILENVGSMSELRALATEAIAAQSGQRLLGKRMSRGADQSFNGLGLPALFGDISEPVPTPVGPHCWWWHTPDDLADKIDEPTLVRDTRIYVHATWRLLTDLVLPLDYAAYADDLLAELERLQAALGERLSLDTVALAATALRDNATRLAGASDAAVVNAALMRMARALVPISYTSGDRFAHDPALALPPWPVLRPLHELAAAAPDSDAAKFHTVGAMRARNRVVHALREANVAAQIGQR